MVQRATSDMSDLPSPATPTLRRTVLALGVANTVFWLWTFHFIGAHASPTGDGMEWLAVVPFGALFAAGVVPPVLLALVGRWLWAALLMVLAVSVLNALLLAQIAAEFHHPVAA